MSGQSIGALGLVVGGAVALFALSRPPQPPEKEAGKEVAAKAPERLLPGLRRDGFVQLPNQWSLKPAGRHVELGDFPVNIAIHPTGEFAAVLCAGYREHEVIVVDLNPQRPKIVSRAPIDEGFVGLTFSADGKQVYASGGEHEVVNVFDFDRGYLVKGRSIDVRVGMPNRKTVVGGIALDTTGRDLLVASPWADAIIRVPLVNPDNKKVIPMVAVGVAKEPGKGEPPSPPDGRKEDDKKADPARPYEADDLPLYLPRGTGRQAGVRILWARSAVAVIDLEKNAVIDTWPTAEHPTEMVLSPKGDALYVACANSTRVSVIDPATGKGLQTIHCALYPSAPNGNTPNSLALTPDGEMLFVANADANNLAVLNVSDRRNAKPLGFIPTGWYPTSVRFNAKDKTIYIANGKGLSSRRPTAADPTPFCHGHAT